MTSLMLLVASILGAALCAAFPFAMTYIEPPDTSNDDIETAQGRWEAYFARRNADRTAQQRKPPARQATSLRTAAPRGSLAEQGERATRRFNETREKVLSNIGYEGQSREERLAELSETWQTNPELVTAMFEAEAPGIEREMEALRVRQVRESHDAETVSRTAAGPALAQIPGLSKYIDPTTGENPLQSAVRESLGDPDITQSTKTRLFRTLADPVKGDPDALVEALAGDAMRARDEEATQRQLFDHYLPSLPNDDAPDEVETELNKLPLDRIGALLDELPRNAAREDVLLAIDQANAAPKATRKTRPVTSLNDKSIEELESMLDDATRED